MIKFVITISKTKSSKISLSQFYEYLDGDAMDNPVIPVIAN